MKKKILDDILITFKILSVKDQYRRNDKTPKTEVTELLRKQRTYCPFFNRGVNQQLLKQKHDYIKINEKGATHIPSLHPIFVTCSRIDLSLFQSK